jgi:phage gp29-like protein
VLQAARDKSNYSAGARFTNAYFERAYGYQAGDLAVPAAPAAPTAPGGMAAKLGAASPAFAEAGAIDPVQGETDALAQQGQGAWTDMLGQIESLVAQAPDVATLQQALMQAYGGLDAGQLVKLMAAALALAELKGMDDARTEG